MRALAPFAFASDIDAATLEAFIAKKSRDVQDPDGYRGQIAAVLGHDAYDRLPEIARADARAHRRRRPGDPRREQRAAGGAIPDARLETIAGAGHLFFIEQPEETLRLLRPQATTSMPTLSSALAARGSSTASTASSAAQRDGELVEVGLAGGELLELHAGPHDAAHPAARRGCGRPT